MSPNSKTFKVMVSGCMEKMIMWSWLNDYSEVVLQGPQSQARPWNLVPYWNITF